MGGETYTKREDFFFPYLLPGARGCQRSHPLASSSETPLLGCVSLARLPILCFCPNLTTWFLSRDLLPVTHLFYPSALVALLFTNQNVTAGQNTWGHLERIENPCHTLYNIGYRPVINCIFIFCTENVFGCFRGGFDEVFRFYRELTANKLYI